jgi:hypothetical protein
MVVYRTLLGIDLAAAAVALFFFLWGLSDGTALYAFGTWLMLVGGIAAIIGGGIALARSGRVAAANAVLCILAIPTIGYALFVLMIVITQPRWN